ncbi:MAG: hypothetical protein WAT66_12025 [Actinomycetota bacterium]
MASDAVGEGFDDGVGSGATLSVGLDVGAALGGGVSFAISVGDVDGDGDSVGVASCARTFGARDAMTMMTIDIASIRKTRREVDPPTLNDISDLRLN